MEIAPGRHLLACAFQGLDPVVGVSQFPAGCRDCVGQLPVVVHLLFSGSSRGSGCSLQVVCYACPGLNHALNQVPHYACPGLNHGSVHHHVVHVACLDSGLEGGVDADQNETDHHPDLETVGSGGHPLDGWLRYSDDAAGKGLYAMMKSLQDDLQNDLQHDLQNDLQDDPCFHHYWCHLQA